MIINGREINYISAQLKMACEAEELGDLQKASWHFSLAEDADEQRVLEEGLLGSGSRLEAIDDK